jgi:hypothetical protein
MVDAAMLKILPLQGANQTFLGDANRLPDGQSGTAKASDLVR